MTEKSNIRVRFAPAPTGIMHIGNIRAALLNYLFANQKNGTFVLRIEDTDPERNFDPGAKKILSDLEWLKLDYNEGPVKGGPFTPYFQSERDSIYKNSLKELIEKDLAYKCFCTKEDLDKKRERQLALRVPPRYDKACLKLNQEEIDSFFNENKPYIWRFKIEPGQTLEIEDISKGKIKFLSENLTDFPLTRVDGSFTFLFANSIDDLKMGMTHVFRGEDHLSNSASQTLIYKAFNGTPPKFLHLPIVCNLDGKKLSKRDFGFSIRDLKKEGFLPEAIVNYLAIIGGSFKDEIMSLEELVQNYNFENISSTGQIKYDPSKLKWINHKWIQKLDIEKLIEYSKPYITEIYTSFKSLDKKTQQELIETIKTDINTLSEIPKHISWFFEEPKIQLNTTQEIFENIEQEIKVKKIINDNLNLITNPEGFLNKIKDQAKIEEIPLKYFMMFLRYGLIGQTKGPNLKIVLELIKEDSGNRIKKLIG